MNLPSRRHILLLAVVLAALAVAGCGSDLSENQSSQGGAASSSEGAKAEEYFPEAGDMESEIRSNGDFSEDGNKKRIKSVDCEAGDDTSEWHCAVRFLGAVNPIAYFVEVDEDGAWAASPDVADAEEMQAAGEVVINGCAAYAEDNGGTTSECMTEFFDDANQCFELDPEATEEQCAEAFGTEPSASEAESIERDCALRGLGPDGDSSLCIGTGECVADFYSLPEWRKLAPTKRKDAVTACSPE